MYDRGKLRGKNILQNLEIFIYLWEVPEGGGGGFNFGETFFKENMLAL